MTGEEDIADHPERLAELDTQPHVWLVDPLDGTANFAAGNPDFGVLVVEVRFGRPMRSWIWQPVHGVLFVADREQGTVTRNSARLAHPADGPARRGLAAEPFVAQLCAEPWLNRTRIMLGSCAIDYPEILVGRSDFLVHDTRRPWDHWPGMLALELLGGVVRMADGSALTATGPGRLPLIAARDQITWDRLAAVCAR